MKQIRDFQREVLKASNLSIDRRFRSWVKWIDRVDTNKTDGYAFVGDFIKDGTIEIEIGKPRLLLAQATSGSMKYNYSYYRVVQLNADGSLAPLNIESNSQQNGWALRIRDEVKSVLDSLNGATTETVSITLTNPIIIEIFQRMKTQTPSLTDEEIIGAALNLAEGVYEARHA